MLHRLLIPQFTGKTGIMWKIAMVPGRRTMRRKPVLLDSVFCQIFPLEAKRTAVYARVIAPLMRMYETMTDMVNTPFSIRAMVNSEDRAM